MMLRRLLLLFFWILAAGSYSGLFAKELRIHDFDGRPVENYQQIVKTLEPGDIILSARDRLPLDYTPIRFGTDIIAKIKNEKSVVRINSSYPPHGDDNITQILDGEGILEILGVDHNSIDLARSQFGRFIIHEYYPSIELLEHYLMRRSEGKGSPLADRALVAFAESTSPFYFIGDFGPDQVGFNGERWLLLDWSNEHYLIESPVQGHTWDRADFINNIDLYEDLEATIKHQRKNMDTKSPCLLQNIKRGLASLPQ